MWHMVCVCLLSRFSCIRLFVTQWTEALQTPLSIGFFRQEYWSGLPCPSLGNLPDPGIELTSLMSPALAGGFFTTSVTWEARGIWYYWSKLFIPSLLVKCFCGPSAGKESTCIAGDPGLIPRLGRSAGEGIGYPLQYFWASLMVQLVKNPSAVRESWVWSLAGEDPLEKGMGTHSSILAWEFHGLSLHDWPLSLHFPLHSLIWLIKGYALQFVFLATSVFF